MRFMDSLLAGKKGKRWMSGIMAAVLLASAAEFPLPAQASDVWPQKATTPFFCLDGGKGWKETDRYDIYKYDTLPSPLTEVQTKRLFWAYPNNWRVLKEAAKKYDPELYKEIGATSSSANLVKRVKDDAGSKFAWVADNPEIEARAIAVMEQAAAEESQEGKEAPEGIREATSEDTAVSFMVPPFSDGPGALDTEFVLGKDFIRDIAKIEPQSVWDNGSTGGTVGWLDASQDKNIAKSVLGENLYEVTWSGDSIRIRNNGSAAANENAVGSNMSEEEKYNKTTVRYKITMRGNAGWYTEGSWDDDYLHQWMDFKACANAPDHQRLYKADIRIMPSDMVFYLVIGQENGGESGTQKPRPEYGTAEPELRFQIFRHEEMFESSYNVRLKKLDDETGMPLKGSQFYLYEKFEDGDELSGDERNGRLCEENAGFTPWEGFRIFAEGTTDENGEISHTDKRSYLYSKTYCDGHPAPKWAEAAEGDADAKELAEDKNQAIAKEWQELVEACEAEAENGDGTHFHWMAEEGEPEDGDAFEASGCKADCEETYDRFIHLRFTYTWKEIQARNGYILHDLHGDDVPVETVTTVSSEAGAEAYYGEGSSKDIEENAWYSGTGEAVSGAKKEDMVRAASVRTRQERILRASDSNASLGGVVSGGAALSGEAVLVTPSNAWRIFSMLLPREESGNDFDDSDWEEKDGGDFKSCLNSARADGILHLGEGESGLFSHCGGREACGDFWIVRDHRTEGKIKINKRDMDLYKGESDEYSSFGDTEGDGTLEGAVYGLFAAEDIVHPDSDIAGDGTLTNTGIVYRMNDLVSAAVTDRDGNAEFLAYSEMPGMTYDYGTGKIVRRTDVDWSGPANLYTENLKAYGNYWIGRPLILGTYYIKELTRSEGYELSVNGISAEWTNSKAALDTPAQLTSLSGTAVVSIPELAASMAGEDGSGNGYDQLPFTVTSTGTVNAENGTDGYTIVVSGLPEHTEFYRVDSGEKDVTGPRVTGTQEVPVTDSLGNPVWKTAERDGEYIKYVPEYGEDGRIVGQAPMSRTEPQMLKAEYIPQMRAMKLTDLELNADDTILNERIQDHDLSSEEDEVFRFIKAETEDILSRNGYEVPVTADGVCSSREEPVYSRGVVKGQTDKYGITTAAGETAPRTYYGAAVKELTVETADRELTVLDLIGEILLWYQENPQWSFGGVDSIRKGGKDWKVTLYAGASLKGSRQFFTMQEQNGELCADKVYLLLENPVTLRWMYQEYGSEASEEYQYRAEKQYYFGSGTEKRYYMDAALTPAVLVDRNGDIQNVDHTVMVYHEAGEEIVDYLTGDADNGYRVRLTETADRVEVTTERELTETDVRLTDVEYDQTTGSYRIRVRSKGTDSFGKEFTDETGRLTLSFMAKLPEKRAVLSSEDLEQLGAGNIHGYVPGESIGYAEYLLRLGGASISAATNAGADAEDTYIVTKRLAYRGQDRICEDGDTGKNPVQVLERPIKQKVKVVKKILEEEAIGNFRFKIYLKSNLERLFCDDNGTIVWVNRNGEEIDVQKYHEGYPERVPKLYTRDTGHSLIENGSYEKFFDAIRVANTDQWQCEGGILNSSFKPFVSGRYTGVENTVNSSDDAKENATRSDAVRQFAVDWYLKEKVKEEETEEELRYADEIYDRALYAAILKAEEYLKPFFLYDLDSLYAIEWDSEKNGGIDRDRVTLSAWQIEEKDGKAEYAWGISAYLPYGNYVLVEQQPYKAEWMDFENRHYRIDTPKEVSLPSVYEDREEAAKQLSNEYVYRNTGDPTDIEEKYHIRFDGAWAEQAEEGNYTPALVPWSVTEAEGSGALTGYADCSFLNRLFRVKLRIEKLDAETGEQILHDDGVFALYLAERDDAKDGNGCIKRYEENTIVRGSKLFLEAMGAIDITPVARISGSGGSAGTDFYGVIPKGTPVCQEKDCVFWQDEDGKRTGTFYALSTSYDGGEEDILQVTGYLETPEALSAGVYVLAELKAPAGYVRSAPIPVEIYSDKVTYYPDGGTDRVAAVRLGNVKGVRDSETENGETEKETARIYVNNTATSLEVSKKKTADSSRGMKISGRVEGTITKLNAVYGLENLELAYNAMGTYLGFGWKRGTLEYLEGRKTSGERVEIVYENGVFQGYGYVTRTLESADSGNRYVAGARMALFEAIEVRPSGDSEDYAFEGVEIERDRNGNVRDIVVSEDAAGETLRLLETEDGVWSFKEVKRGDTSVLFYDLGGLEVLSTSADGTLYGYGREGERMKITFDTDSIYALRGGRPVFELSGGDFSKLTYDRQAKAFTAQDDDTVIYHLDEKLVRDSQVDGYTGLAYVMKSGKGPLGRDEDHFYVWPVTVLKDENGAVIGREKILTGRPGEMNAGTESAYITGTWNPETGRFEKRMRPKLDPYGMVLYYPPNDNVYSKGEPIYDRDGDYLGYRYDDLLDEYNRASYDQKGEDELYCESGDEEEADLVAHRAGEAWMIPNIWITGERTPQDPSTREMTWGQADLLRRIVPGTYIMEELEAPDGYVRGLPVAVCVEESKEIQRVSVTEERIKVEIVKVDGTDQYRIPVVDGDSGKETEWNTEGRGAYHNQIISGAELALYRARRIYTSDLENYPKGYYLVKTEETPACWEVEDLVDNHPVSVTAQWITDGRPKYFEGIPAGDYILEELSSPEGYVPASIEITVKAVSELQSFFLKDDHTKLEIFKYEEDENGERISLSWPYQAGFALYPAALEADGSIKMQDGTYVCEKEIPVDTWETGMLAEYGTAMPEAFEAMFLEYGDSFRIFSWKTIVAGESNEALSATSAGRTSTEIIRQAKRLESHSTGNGEIVTQLWELSDGKRFRVTVSRTDGSGQTDAFGRPKAAFEYQFNYKAGKYEKAPEMISYDTRDGLHRIDRIPVGQYILVETRTPPGYQTAEPRLITVKENGNVQRYSIENRRKTVYVDKTDEERHSLAGAKLALYRENDSGYLMENEEYLVDQWVSGTEGFYDADDLAAGRIPEGYKPGDMRIHRLPPIGEGIYYLVEKRAPAYCIPMEPKRLEINGSSETVVQAANRVAKGQIMIEKADSEWYGMKLAGAWFEVKNITTGEISRMVTNENGKAVFGKLSTGYADQKGNVVPFEYQVREIQAPEGYRTSSDTWKFRFEDSGQPTLTYQMKVENEKTRLWFSKTDFKTGHFVEGAKLAVYQARTEEGTYVPYGDPIETWVSGQEPHLVIGKLSGSRRYFLVEQEAPAGYSVSPPVMFTISPDGKRIAEVYDHFQAVQIVCEQDSQRIHSVSILGRTATGGSCILEKGEIELLRVPLTGTIKIPIKQQNGEILSLCEEIEFSDGSSVMTEKETFRVRDQGAETEVRRRRIPIRSEYVLSDGENRVLERWESSGNDAAHNIVNVRDENGKMMFMPGGVYRIEENVFFDDESRAVTGRMEIRIGEGGSVDCVDLKNRQTEVRIKKTDMVTGKELPGAVLTLSDESGAVLEEWISGTGEHVITGALKPGTVYILSEKSAPDGYLTAEEVTFTVSADGRIDRVIMEDQRKEPEEPDKPEEPTNPEEPEKPEEPTNPQEPEEPTNPEEPEKPTRPEKPERPSDDGEEEPEEPKTEPESPAPEEETSAEKKSVGIITARYDTGFAGDAELHVRYPGRIRSSQDMYVQIPETGDANSPWLRGIGFILAAVAAVSFAAFAGRDENEE